MKNPVCPKMKLKHRVFIHPQYRGGSSFSTTKSDFWVINRWNSYAPKRTLAGSGIRLIWNDVFASPNEQDGVPSSQPQDARE